MNIDCIRRGLDQRRFGKQPKSDFFFWAAFALLLFIALSVYSQTADVTGEALEHPLWTGCAALLGLLGLPEPWAAAVASSVFKMLTFFVTRQVIFLYLDGDESASNRATLTALLVMIAAPVRILSVNPAVTAGIGSPAFWSAPQSAAPLIALGCLLYAAHCIYEHDTLQRKQVFLLTAVLLLGALSQPGLLRVFLPAYCVYLLLFFLRHPKEKRFVSRMLLALLPAAAWILAKSLLAPDSITYVFSFQSLWLAARNLLMMAALPLFILLLIPWKETLRDPVVILCLLFAGTSVLAASFLPGEAQYADGNQAGMAAAFLLWVVMPPRLINAVRAYHHDRQKLREYAEHGALSSAVLSRRNARLQRLSAGFFAGFILMFWHLYAALYHLYHLLSTSGL